MKKPSQDKIVEARLQYEGSYKLYHEMGEKAKGKPHDSDDWHRYEMAKKRYLLDGETLRALSAPKARRGMKRGKGGG